MVAGGNDNSASGDYSFAAGNHAHAIHDGAFVWSDSSGGTFQSYGNNRFTARTSGGVYFYTNSSLTAGSYLASGGSSWNSVSDRARKENLAAVDGSALLDAIAEMEISTWNYIEQDDAIRHVGPMAQEFNTLLPGLGGEGEKYINSLDADGVALAAIQALAAENEGLKQRIDSLEAGQTVWQLAAKLLLVVAILFIGPGTVILVRLHRLTLSLRRDES